MKFDISINAAITLVGLAAALPLMLAISVQIEEAHSDIKRMQASYSEMLVLMKYNREDMRTLAASKSE